MRGGGGGWKFLVTEFVFFAKTSSWGLKTQTNFFFGGGGGGGEEFISFFPLLNFFS